MSGGARYVIDNLATTGDDYTIQAIQTQGGLAVSSGGTVDLGPLEYNNGLITGPGFAFLTIDVAVPASFQDDIAQWEFRYETFGTAIAAPGPRTEVPVPAARPLLATAMGLLRSGAKHPPIRARARSVSRPAAGRRESLAKARVKA